MAQHAAMRQVFQRLGFSQQAATAVVDDQGINSLDELRILKDDEITNLCKVIRRPGGQIANPNPDVQGNIPNPGIMVSLRAEHNTKLARYMLMHRTIRIARPCDHADITLDAVRAYAEMRDYELNYENPETKPTIDDKDWPKTFEALEQYFTSKRGEYHIPLAYVIRDEVDPPAPADDPEGNYATPVEEMIARAPHERNGQLDPVFIINSGKVLDDLADMFRETMSWTYMKDFVQPRDGRGAYLALFNHYLGPNNVNNQSAASEKALATISYNGEGRRWNFEKYVTAQKKHHQILEGLVRYGYSGIDPTTKVRYLMNGIKTRELDVPTGQILGNPTLRSDFDGSVTLYKDFINQSKSASASGSSAPTRSVSATGVTKGNSIEDRYYSPAEYAKLTNEQREELRQARAKRGHVKGAKDSKTLPGQVTKKQKMEGKRTIAALKKIDKRMDSIEKKLAATDSNVPDTVSTDGSSTQGSNSNNAALTRQN